MEQNDQYTIDTSFNNKFGSILNKYIPKIEEVKQKINPAIKVRKISERGTYTTELLSLINKEQEKQGKKKYDYRYFAFKISHIPTQDLYHCIKNYKNNTSFWYSLKVK